MSFFYNPPPPLCFAINSEQDMVFFTPPPPPRSILYDLTELENAARIKKGETERTAKKAAIVQKWFAKIDKDFEALLAYY